MPETEGDAQLGGDFLRGEIPKLAALYDRFAHALDPFDEGCDIAEKTFNAEITRYYDYLEAAPKPEFRDFRRWIIQRCKQHLRASDKPPSV
jgi:hypothetical protein